MNKPTFTSEQAQEALNAINKQLIETIEGWLKQIPGHRVDIPEEDTVNLMCDSNEQFVGIYINPEGEIIVLTNGYMSYDLRLGEMLVERDLIFLLGYIETHITVKEG